jgi:signal transduction histidine kinase
VASPLRSISSRQFGGLFLLSALLPSVLLVVLGWQLLRQDADLERQRARDDREQAADAAVAALSSELMLVEAWLREGNVPQHLTTSSDVVVVEFASAGVRVDPPARLIYLPNPPSLHEANSATFETAEQKEFRDQDPAGAAELYRQLTRSRNATTKAVALMGLARTLRRKGEYDDALQAYAAAADADRIGVAGTPVALLARRGSCEILEQLGRTTELRAAAAELERQLRDGRWPLHAATFEAQLGDLERWAGGPPNFAPEARALAEAVRRSWVQWNESDGPFSQRSLVRVADTDVTLIVQATATGARLLLATPQFVETHFLSKARPGIRSGVEIRLEPAGHRPPGAPVTRRLTGDSGLPWTVTASSALEATAALNPRRRLWFAGVGAMLLIVFGGSYMIQRLVARELAVAQLQSEFVAAVSHEFRTPLTSLRQLSEMLIDRPEAPAERRVHYYAALQRQTERLQRLVESLLDFGRLESGRAAYRLQPVEITPLVARIVQDFSEDGAARGHAVSFESRGHGAVAADPDAIRNALWNLLDNAAKYSPASEPIIVSVNWGDGSVELEVRDAGPGIPSHEHGRIFEKFVRGERARHDGVAGTGIGLAMVQHIAMAHGGAVHVRSEPGAGAVFTLVLPSIRQVVVEGAS